MRGTPQFSQLLPYLGTGFVVTLGIFLFALWYFHKKLEKKLEPKKEVDTEKMLKLLNPIERKVIQRLINLGGAALQSDLSRELDKLRVHRAVKSLQSKGIIEVTPKGRTRFIRISKEFKGFINP